MKTLEGELINLLVNKAYELMPAYKDKNQINYNVAIPCSNISVITTSQKCELFMNNCSSIMNMGQIRSLWNRV